MDFTFEEKALLVARHLSCDQCSCQGWRPSSQEQNNTLCYCGHSVNTHVDHFEDMERRVKLALRIKDILKENNKENDYDYTNNTIRSLQKQMLEHSLTEGFLSEASSLSSIDGDERYSKREREGTEESEAKRHKSDTHGHEDDIDDNDDDEEEEDDDDDDDVDDDDDEVPNDNDDDDEDVEEEDDDADADVDEDDDDDDDEDRDDDDDDDAAADDEEEEPEDENVEHGRHQQSDAYTTKAPPSDSIPTTTKESSDISTIESQNVESRSSRKSNPSTAGNRDDNQQEQQQQQQNGHNNQGDTKKIQDEDEGNRSMDIDKESEGQSAQIGRKTKAIGTAEPTMGSSSSSTATASEITIKNGSLENEPPNAELLNEESLNVNGLPHDKDGPLNDDGSIKSLEEFTLLERKENPAMIEERNGDIEVKVVLNDGAPESMIYLTGLKNIFQKQLPMMPKEYIARLVYDRNHRSIALIRRPMKVIGGICYRPFDAQEFAEIVFCAIASTEQVKGYGSHLMNHLKDYVTTHTPMKHFLTYADNYATGYFKKQGFTTDITLDRRNWVGYIKDYEGGTIMQCTVVPKVKYLQAQSILAIQRQAVYEKTKQFSTSHIVFPGLEMPVGEDGKRSIDPLSVPGVRESGWTPEMDQLSNRPRHPPHYNQMRHLVSELQSHASSWPFSEPVNADEVVDYYDVITEPMDLTTLEQNVEGDMYSTMEEFVTDVQKIFDNCRTYNAEGTNYARCATKLERYFKERLQVWSGNSN